MTDTSLRPLPILTPDKELPTGEALEALRRAKLATGYAGMVLPSRASQGSPAPILAVGCYPDWLTDFVYVADWTDEGKLTTALKAILLEEGAGWSVMGDTYLLSKWFGGPVKYAGEERYGD
jgi:hypothetical protein